MGSLDAIEGCGGFPESGSIEFDRSPGNAWSDTSSDPVCGTDSWDLEGPDFGGNACTGFGGWGQSNGPTSGYGDFAPELGSGADAISPLGGEGITLFNGPDSLFNVSYTVSVTDTCGAYFSRQVYPEVGPVCVSLPIFEATNSWASFSFSYGRCTDGTSSISGAVGIGIGGCALASASLNSSLDSPSPSLGVRVGTVEISPDVTFGPGAAFLYGDLEREILRACSTGHF